MIKYATVWAITRLIKHGYAKLTYRSRKPDGSNLICYPSTLLIGIKVFHIQSYAF